MDYVPVGASSGLLIVAVLVIAAIAVAWLAFRRR